MEVIQEKEINNLAQELKQKSKENGDKAKKTGKKPSFPRIKGQKAVKTEYRRIRISPHRVSPLKTNWENIMKVVVENLKLQIRFNPKTKSVEIKTGPSTTESVNVQKASDFLTAFNMGFDFQDAVAMLRIDDLFLDSFQVTDVKYLNGDHLSRAVGRIAGHNGKTRFAIENATKTRIVIADQKVHILGSFGNIKLARNAICSLIMGAPPGTVYNQMRNVARRMNERF